MGTPLEFIQPLSEYAQDLGIQFACTPFYLDEVNVLEPNDDFYKIASKELLLLDLINSCSMTGKPLIISSGMSCLSEVISAVDSAISHDCIDLTVLHCVSAYPTLPKDCNLSVISFYGRIGM